jgi:hypothetical protein
VLLPGFAAAQTPPDSATLRPATSDTVAPTPVPDAAARAAADTVRADSAAGPRVPSPGGAFLRSVLVPGWGQAAYGKYIRGGVYFAAETGSWFMLLKTMAKLGEARQIEAKRMGFVRDSVIAEIGEKYRDNPAELEQLVGQAVDNHEGVKAVRGVIDARKSQREDWIFQILFWMFASGADAYVTAHLSDFPARVIATPRQDGKFDVGVRVRAGAVK